MRFSCNRQQLSGVLSILGDVVPPRSAKPVLQNISFKPNEDGTLCLSATDLEIGISYNFPVEDLSDPEPVLLPASKLSGILRDDWSESVCFSIEDGHAEIMMDNRKFNLVGNSSEEFPPIPTIDENKYFEMNGEDIIDAISKTIFATARGDTRYALNGIFLKVKENNAEFVASDTHRLSLSKKKIRHDSEESQDAIVLTKGMQELSKLSAGQETVKICLTQHEMIAETSAATLVARLVDGQFPRYQDVIPKDMTGKIVCNCDQLGKSLRLAGQVTNEETKSVELATDGAELLVKASGSEAGDATLPLAADIECDELSIAFNYTFITDLLKVIADDNITMQFRGGDSPMRVDAGDFTHIIMPIKARS